MLLDYTRLEKAFKVKGFHFLKIELEANVRYTDNSDMTECGSCDGAGTRTYWGDDEESECENCNGTGEVYEHSSDYPNLEGFSERFGAKIGRRLMNALTYYDTYNDGSVNTEVTLTMPVEYISELPGMLTSFKEVCDHFGGADVSNAGMHITLMQSGDYECLDELPRTHIRNFRNGMERVIDSMYLLASGDGVSTRGMRFRRSQVSNDDKYSAIYTHRDTCIEYRIFDTCYDKPDRISVFLNTIVRTLKFYAAHRQPGIDYNQHKVVETNGMRRLTRLYNHKEEVARLLTELAFIHPSPKRVDYLKKRFESGMVSQDLIINQLARG